MIGLARPHAVIAADPGTPGARGGLASLMSTLFLVLGVSPLAGQFSASPVILEVRTSDGAGVEATEAVESTITVTNESEDRLQLRVYPADFDQAADGAHTFLEPGSHDRSCADRLEIFPASLVLDAGGSEVVRVRLMPGDSACWSMVFVQSVDRSEQGFRIAQRIGVKVYGVAAGVPSEGEIREVAVARYADGITATIEFANTGGAPVRPEGEIEVRSESGELVGVVPVAPFSVLPGRSASARVPLPLDLPRGRYVVVPILDFGGDYLAGGQGLLEVMDGS